MCMPARCCFAPSSVRNVQRHYQPIFVNFPPLLKNTCSLHQTCVNLSQFQSSFGNGKSARSFSARIFFAPHWSHGCPHVRVMDVRVQIALLCFPRFRGPARSFWPGTSAWMAPRRPRDIRPENSLFVLVFPSWKLYISSRSCKTKRRISWPWQVGVRASEPTFHPSRRRDHPHKNYFQINSQTLFSGHVIPYLTGNKFSKNIFRSCNLLLRDCFLGSILKHTNTWKEINLGICFFRSRNALHEIK